MKPGVICLGEALIDFIPTDSSNSQFIKSPGGAPANVAVGLAKMGIDSYFAGKLGEDVMGRFLFDTLQSFGVKTEMISFTKEAKTGVVFVTNSSNGERAFDFYINPAADQLLEEADIKEDLFEKASVLHYGSISLIGESARRATYRAVNTAGEKQMLLSFDPNIRPALWPSIEEAVEQIKEMLPKADIVKVSEEELELISGEAEEERALQQMQKYNIPVLIITKGELGSTLIVGKEKWNVPVEKVDAVDTTGAGDAYVSGLLSAIIEKGRSIQHLSKEDWMDIARAASVSGGLAASVKGAMAALPTREDVNRRK